jgi:hypothetical protein
MATGVLARCAGDVIDTVAHGVAGTKTKKPFSFGVCTALLLGIGLADMLCAKRLTR